MKGHVRVLPWTWLPISGITVPQWFAYFDNQSTTSMTTVYSSTNRSGMVIPLIGNHVHRNYIHVTFHDRALPLLDPSPRI